MVIWGEASSRQSSSRALFFGFLVLAGLTVAGLPGTPADAQAIIESSQPAAGGVMAGPDVDIVLHYNSRVDHERSRLILKRPDGTAMPLTIDRAAAGATVITARVKGLANGAYFLRWQVLATDGHLTRGDIPFSVAVGDRRP